MVQIVFQYIPLHLLLFSKTHFLDEMCLTFHLFQMNSFAIWTQMPLYFRIKYHDRILAHGYIYTILCLTMIQFFFWLLLDATQKAVFTFRMSNITISSTGSYRTVPFQECICSIISIGECIVDSLLRDIRVVPLLLFALLVYFFWNGLTISGDGVHIFVYLYWMCCFVGFFTILIIVYWKNCYYSEMSILLIVMTLSEILIYAISTLPNYSAWYFYKNKYTMQA